MSKTASKDAQNGVAPRRPRVRRPIGTFYLLAQKLVFHNSDLNKSTIVCKVGILEVSPRPFWIWKHIHVHKVHVYEVYADEVKSVHARGGIHTTTILSLRVSSIQNLAYRIQKRYVVSCVASTRQICFPTSAGELPANLAQGQQPRGQPWQAPASLQVPLPNRGPQGAILESRTFTYRPACCLTKWPVAQWGGPFTKQCNLTYAGQDLYTVLLSSEES